MNWLRLHRSSAVLIGLTLLLPVYFYIKTLFGLLGLGADYAAERSRIAPRVARLQGLLEVEVQLSEQSGLASRQLAEVVVPKDQDSSALAATLQAEVRQLLSDAGLSVKQIQVTPPRPGEVFDRVGVKVTATGDLAGLDAAMISIAAYRPRLLVEKLDAFPSRVTRRRGAPETQGLTAMIELVVLRSAL